MDKIYTEGYFVQGFNIPAGLGVQRDGGGEANGLECEGGGVAEVSGRSYSVFHFPEPLARLCLPNMHLAF